MKTTVEVDVETAHSSGQSKSLQRTESALCEEDEKHQEGEEGKGKQRVEDAALAHKDISAFWLAFLIIVLGSAATAALLSVGIVSAKNSKEQLFRVDTQEFTEQIKIAWRDYEMAAHFTHLYVSSFREDPRLAENKSEALSMEQFQVLYEHLAAAGIDVQVEYLPLVLRDERAAYEESAREYYEEYYPEIDYPGFREYNWTDFTLMPRGEHDFYYPLHYMLPIFDGDEDAIGVDTYSIEPFQVWLDKAVETWEPVLSSPVRIAREVQDHPDLRGVLLNHPGKKIPSMPSDYRPTEIAVFVIRVVDLMERAYQSLGHSFRIYLYDDTDYLAGLEDFGYFLGASDLVYTKQEGSPGTRRQDVLPLTRYDDIDYMDRPSDEHNIAIADRTWRVVFIATDSEFDPDLAYVIVGGVLLFVCTLLCAGWVSFYILREKRIKQMRLEAEMEKAEYILLAAKRATEAERLQNEFIAHEVRNPISAALSACMFVKTAVAPSRSVDELKASAETCREDVNVIENSLCFINDLLRNILDMNRASSGQLSIHKKPTDVYNDILMPVSAMLHRRGAPVEVLVECPKDLIVDTDPLRLKQVILNLGRNSSKFVAKGYIRLVAELTEAGMVQLRVEDSGPGVPEEKRKTLFSKFQTSLDNLSQGTGVGLYLCEKLISLMGGRIWLDESFDSGIKDIPGARIVIDLNVPPCALDEEPEESVTTNTSMTTATTATQQLPENVRVLFVDDDSTVRRMFCRSLTKVAPTWTIDQAASGETSLKMLETATYDIIMVDMYMASTGKQLLGTETVQEIRNNGFKGILCGTSANDMEKEFKMVGADMFLLKPFPFTEISMRKTMLDIVHCRDSASNPEFLLPEHIKVLFVDDDVMIRRMFSRAIKTVAPTWKITEASSGESALKHAETGSLEEGDGPYDLIFMDMYMASAEKQLVGTEAVQELRNIGVTGLICGCSGNDMESEFKAAGADAFLMKPFPFSKDSLRAAMTEVVNSRRHLTSSSSS